MFVFAQVHSCIGLQVCAYIYINILHMQDEVMKLSRTYTESKQEAHADIAI